MIVLYGKVNMSDDAASRGTFNYKLFDPATNTQVRFSGRISTDADADYGEISVDPQKGVIERYETSKECLAQLKKCVGVAQKKQVLFDLSDVQTFKATDLDPDPVPENASESPESESESPESESESPESDQ